MKHQIYIFISIICLMLLGCESSDTDKINKETYLEIQNWYFKNKSIENNINSEGTISNRSIEEKQLRISLNRLQLELNENWKFEFQSFTVKNVSPTRALIEVNSMFTKSSETALRTEIYYYNSAEILFNPVPIEDVSYIGEKDNFKPIYKKLIWEGDFNSYLNDLY